MGAGADANAKGYNGTPVLFWAIDDEPYSAEMVQILVNGGADGSVTDRNGRTMVYWATILSLPEIVEILVSGNF